MPFILQGMADEAVWTSQNRRYSIQVWVVDKIGVVTSFTRKLVITLMSHFTSKLSRLFDLRSWMHQYLLQMIYVFFFFTHCTAYPDNKRGFCH